MTPDPCAFDATPTWPGDPTAPLALDVPRVLIDFSTPAFDLDGAGAIARQLGGERTAVLLGEHQNRPDFPPVLVAQRILAEGATPWVTLACRDRNRIVLEQELRGLARVGVRTVLCVTGDGRGYDVRPDVTQVFDLDGTRLAALARSLGLAPAVAETITAPPRSIRAGRLVEKQRAGAGVAVLNHASPVQTVAAFVAQARELGLAVPVIAAAAVFTDAASAAVLSGLPGLELDPHTVETVLGADDPVEAGIGAAVDEARALLGIPGVAGVNLSGAATGTGFGHGAEIKAEIARRVLAAAP